MLLLTSELDSIKGKLMLTKNFDYNLNLQKQENLDFFIDNVSFKAKVLKNYHFAKIQKNQNGITIKLLFLL